jgi:hypothetical protein
MGLDVARFELEFFCSFIGCYFVTKIKKSEQATIAKIVITAAVFDEHRAFDAAGLQEMIKRVSIAEVAEATKSATSEFISLNSSLRKQLHLNCRRTVLFCKKKSRRRWRI